MAKHKPIRWKIGTAAAEMGIDPKTLASRLKASSIEAAKDGMFSTKQIFAAVAGDLELERIGLTREQKEIAAMKKKQMLRELIPVQLVEKVWSSVIQNLAQAISFAPLTPTARQELSRQCVAIPMDDYFLTADTTADAEKPPTEKEK
jgi:hypothetical protein